MFNCRLTLTTGHSQSQLTYLFFDVFLTVHHSIDFSKYEFSAQFF